MLGAITGHAVSNNATGAGIGAMAGFGIALYMYSKPFTDLSHQPLLDHSTNNYLLMKSNSGKSNQSGFLSN
jgi:hypothetical protein